MTCFAMVFKPFWEQKRVKSCSEAFVGPFNQTDALLSTNISSLELRADHLTLIKVVAAIL
jgi:hypothetical protein